MITIAVIIKGIRKWREKNRVSVGWFTEKPPHIHSTIVFPRQGIAEKMFVITVAPQNDICPQGRTQPRNAVAINISKIIMPEDQVLVLFAGEEKNRPRIMCMYIRMKNNLALEA